MLALLVVLLIAVIFAGYSIFAVPILLVIAYLVIGRTRSLSAEKRKSYKQLILLAILLFVVVAIIMFIVVFRVFRYWGFA